MFRDYDADEGLKIMFYNVSMTVGKEKDPNRRDDVLLVQYFLHEIYANPLKVDPAVFPGGITIGTVGPDGIGIPEKPVKVDGFCGPQTRKWIGWFQGQMSTIGFPLHRDSRVHKAKGFESKIKNTIYTIRMLNLMFQQVHPYIFDDLENHWEVPPEVRSSITLGKK
jgi:hypothetical protein